MRNRLGSIVVTCLLGASFVLAAEAVAEESTSSCTDGVLATDSAGDGTYAGQTGTDLESDAADLLTVSTTLQPAAPVVDDDGKKPKKEKKPKDGDETTAPTAAEATDAVTFTTDVADLQPTDPQHFDLLLNLELITEAGQVIAMDARRSAITGQTGSVDGSSEGVTAEFDEVADEIRLTVPSTVFDAVSTVTLQLAQTRYDSGAGLSPLADEASGTCAVVLDAGYTPPPAEDHSDLDTSVLVIDTGVNGQHPEFADGQIFAWWDFSQFPGDADHAAGSPDPGTATWFDTDGDGEFHGDRDDPYDPDGHGSSVSSMAAGSNAITPAKTPSACPGCSLAVAKVLDQSTINGALNGSVSDAVRWGVDVLDVDVISVSIGALAPIPAVLLADTYDAIEYARDAGVLVVFANGNGWGNAGGPGQPGGFMPYGNSTDVLSVGADDLDSFTATTDPEVVAVYSVHAAGPEGAQYQDISGTSFSAPFTAGVATRLIGEGRACGSSDLGPDSIEQLIKYTAADRPEVPPTFEGYGVVTLDTMATALGVLCEGAAMPVPDELNDFYVTNVSGTQREISSNRDGSPVGMQRTSFTDVTGPGELGPSGPSGPKDAEIFTTTVAPGETFTMTATGTGDLTDVYDFDMVLYEGVADAYAATAELTSSGNGGAVMEELTWTNATGAPVLVSAVVYGWSIVDSQPFAHVSSHELTRDFDGYVVADNLVL